ncbi:amidohydrolase family protein [Amorphus sp. 3PC139-8]|uniref:amidohydrolase family protein n=1 Tax=Amorphus sp. 3PC139-8 TaxID=2735676 RepID=UPI00345D0284
MDFNLTGLPAEGPPVEDFDTTKLLRNAARQARKRHYEDFFICDVDAHHYETEALPEILEYMDDLVLRHLGVSSGNVGRSGLIPSVIGSQDMAGRVTRYPGRRHETVPETPHRDITLTRRWMDALGVDMACLFPTPMLTLATHPQSDVEVAMARAYNRWLCERILEEDPRICSMLYLPLNEPHEAERIVEEFGERRGVVGFLSTGYLKRPVHDNANMRVYAMLEERGMPLGFHAVYHWGDTSLAQLNRFISVHALGFTFCNILHMTNWLMNGMPERFPKLKTIWIESGLAWIPFVMQRLDNEYMMRTSEAPLLKRKPSEYMREMYYSSQPMEMVDNREALEVTFKMINAETQLLYSSDYPHWDMDLPSTIYDLPFLSEQSKRDILGGNAQKLFNIEPLLADWKVEARAAGPGSGVRQDSRV